jgi:NAD(P)-dependent dehydrogenase (short-subunit alcohol dehydrogenase family)
MLTSLVGKTAFVTGAASGIGLGIATALATAGAKVMLYDIDDEALRSAVERLGRTNADVDGFEADVSLKAELQAAADATIARFGKMHILVNNAGVIGSGDYGTWSDASWSWSIGVNLMSVIWGIEIFGPLIEAHGEGGQIVSTASAAGLYPLGSPPAYAVTKYGVVALSEGLRVTLAARGIGVSVLCPGIVRTQILSSGPKVPLRFGAIEGFPADGPVAEGVKGAISAMRNGVDPFYVGELVREAIENDWPYILIDADFESAIEERFSAIRQGFDRIRAREPVR